MSFSFTAATRDGLSNLAASLGAGRDKAAGDRFTLFDLDRSQVEAMYRGDWLARKVVDIVPYDMVREWRAWSGHRADVERAEAAERRLGLRKAVQRALVLGRLYGGGGIVIGTGEGDPAALARPLDPEGVGRGGLKFLHVVSRWQLGASSLDADPLSPWCGEPAVYELSAPGRAPLQLHPSRVVRFLGNPLPDPWLGATCWSDPVLQVLYDAVHAVALTTAGATSLMHEAKVDVVTVPNLSEHLSSSDTTAQLSARFAYAAAMKSINNLLLLGDGETWNRQKVDFAGLPEMVRTFLQVAAGAADIPVTRLLGQSPAGLSATGESDVRNYYDMIAARQELDLRPQLERLDALMLRSEGLDPDTMTFAFRPLWQLDEPARAALALAKAQATQVYAGLGLWPADVTARLAEAQLVADGTYPNAAAVFAEAGTAPVVDAGYDPAQLRNPAGQWTARGGNSAAGSAPIIVVANNETEREVEKELEESGIPPSEPEPDTPIIKPFPGMTSHGFLSGVPMPIPPKPLGTSPPGFSPAPPSTGLPRFMTLPPTGQESAPSIPAPMYGQNQKPGNSHNLSEQIEDPQEKSKQEEIRKNLERRFDNTKEHTTDKDLIAAWREAHGDTSLMKADGIPYDHLKEVKQTQTKMKGIIEDVKGLLGRPRLLPSEARPLQDLLGGASRSLDRTEEFVPSNQQKMGDHSILISSLFGKIAVATSR